MTLKVELGWEIEGREQGIREFGNGISESFHIEWVGLSLGPRLKRQIQLKIEPGAVKVMGENEIEPGHTESPGRRAKSRGNKIDVFLTAPACRVLGLGPASLALQHLHPLTVDKSADDRIRDTGPTAYVQAGGGADVDGSL